MRRGEALTVHGLHPLDRVVSGVRKAKQGAVRAHEQQASGRCGVGVLSWRSRCALSARLGCWSE
jgi:hypothetical protein